MSTKIRIVEPLDLDIIAERIIPVCFTVDQLIRMMRKKRGHLTPQKCYVLHLLMKECPDNELGWTMSLLAKHLGISTAATTGLVDALEKRGQVERCHFQGEDRRMVYLEITDVGRAVVKEYTSAFLKDLLDPKGGLLQLFFGSPKKV